MRRTSLENLKDLPGLPALRAVRRVASSDPSPTLRSEAQRILVESAARMTSGGIGRLLTTCESSQQIDALLGSAEPKVRARVAQCLALNLSPAIPLLLAVRLDVESDPLVQAYLIQALAVTGGSQYVPAIAAHVDNHDHRVRHSAIEALTAADDPDLLLHILHRLKDPDMGIRRLVWSSLQHRSRDEVLRTVDVLLSREDATARYTALHVLRFFDEESALRRIEPVLEGQPGLPRDGALETLRFLARKGNVRAGQLLERHGEEAGDKNPVPEATEERLILDLGHSSPGVRIAAMHRLRELCGVRLLDQVEGLLRDPDPAVRQAARSAVRESLARVPVSDQAGPATAVLRESLSRGEESARQALGSALTLAGTIGAEPVARALADRLLQEGDPHLKANILSVLALIGDFSHIDLMRQLVKDADARVRANALDALELLGEQGVDQTAFECLADPDPRVRAAAITASLGTHREPYLTHLRAMLDSGSVTERAAGLYAVRTVAFPGRFELLRDHFLAETHPQLYERCAQSLALELIAGHAEEIAGLIDSLEEGNKRRCLESCIRRSSRDVAASGDPGPPLGEMHALGDILDRKKAGSLTGDHVRQALKNESDPLTITCLLEIAAQMELSDAVELTERFTHSKDRLTRLAALEVLARIDSADAGESLAKLVRDRDPEVAQRAVAELSRLGPGKALAGVRALFELGEDWAFKRGLDLLEKQDAREGLELLYGLLESRSHHLLPDAARRLLDRWGDETVLARLTSLHQTADARRRPLLLELRSALASKLDVSPEELTSRVPPDPEAPEKHSLVSTESTTSLRIKEILDGMRIRESLKVSARSLKLPVDDHGAALRWILKGSGLVVIAVLIWTAGRSLDPGGETRDSADRELAYVPSTRTEFVFQQARTAPSSFTFTGATVEAREWRPTLESVKESLKRALEAKGITSDALIHVFALDRFKIDHRRSIAAARALARRGSHAEAIRVLAAALEATDEDHVTARIALLKTLVKTCSEAGNWDLLDEYRKQLTAMRQVVVDLIVTAAREGGLPQSEIEGVIDRIEKREKKKKANELAVDYLSGRQSVASSDAPAAEG